MYPDYQMEAVVNVLTRAVYFIRKVITIIRPITLPRLIDATLVMTQERSIMRTTPCRI